jgi:hypothetical protein
MRWLAERHPERVEGYQRLYAGKYATRAYRTAVATTVEALRRKYHLEDRESPRGQDAAAAPVVRQAEQRFLRW